MRALVAAGVPLALLGLTPLAAADARPESTSSAGSAAPRRAGAAKARSVPPGAITFSEYSVGTTITNQYVGQGVVFTSNVFISDDDAQPTAPVLSGSPQFEGPVAGYFTAPGSTTATTVNGFTLDVGFINQRNSTEVTYYDSSGVEMGSVPAQSLGINRIEVRQKGIASFRVESVSFEDAGFSVDNFAAVRDVVGVKPTRMASFGDSYSSGEGLIGDKGLDYDCATALARRGYWQDTSAPGFNGAWLSSYCDTRTGSHKRPKDLLKRKVVTYENRCHRHARAYPNAIRSRLAISGANSIFVACSGAVTEDIRSQSQYGDPGSPANIHGGRTQFATVSDFAAEGQPNFVTVGIGGNDAGFAGIIEHCMRTACSEDETWKSGVVTKIQGEMYDQVLATYKEIRAGYSGATVAAFGYPSVIGDPAKDCGGYRALWMTIEQPEREWLKHTVFATLNQALREAAQEAGVTFIDISAVTQGREICEKDPWINGLRLFSRDTSDAVASESFHPNELAHDAIASWFMRNFVSDGRLVFTNPEPTPIIRPAPGSAVSMGEVTTGVYKNGEERYCVQACPITIQGSGYQPGATVTLTVTGGPGAARTGASGLRGGELPLPPAVVGAGGTFSALYKLPRGIRPGTYAVVVGGTAPDSSTQYGTSFFRVFKKDPGRIGYLDADVKRKGKATIRGGAVVAKCLTSLPSIQCRTSVRLKSGAKALATAKAKRKTNRRGQVVVVLKFSPAEVAAVDRVLDRGGVVRAVVAVTAKNMSQKATARTEYRIRRR